MTAGPPATPANPGELWEIAATFPFDKSGVPWWADHVRIQEFDLHAGKTTLEYGCGGGGDAKCYLERNCTVYLADIVPLNVATARDRLVAAGLAAKAHFLVLLKSAPIPLSDRVVEVVNAHGVLHHIEDPGPVVQEFRRVLTPGGLLYAMLYTEALFQRFARRIVEARARGIPDEVEFCRCTDEIPGYARAYTEEEGCALLRSAGFEVLLATVYDNGAFRTFKARKPA